MILQSRSIKNIFRRACSIVITLVVALAFVQPGDAAYGVINRKISGTLPDFTDVLNFRISPEGDYVVFTADQDAEGKDELFVVPLYGGAEPRRLNGPLTYGGKVDPAIFKISNVTRRVVYLADQQALGRVDLYSAPLDGGDSIKLNGTMQADGDVAAFLISPDGQYVVYWADQETDEGYELYSVPITGGVEPVKLNGTLLSGSVDRDFQISPNSAWVVYHAVQDTPGVYELYRNAIGGETPLRLNSGALAGHGTGFFTITPNSGGVVFIANPELEKYDLYSNYMSGTTGACGTGGPFKLSNTVPVYGRVLKHGIAPNGLGVVFFADQEVLGRMELYSNSICGGTANMHKLSGTLPPGIDQVYYFKITSNSAGVVYETRGPSPLYLKELYSNYINVDTPPIHLNPTLPAGGTVMAFDISNNNARVVYLADALELGQTELYSVPIIGLGPSEDPIQLNGTLPPTIDVLDFQLTPNKLGILYRARQDSATHVELYSNSTLGGALIKVNGTLVENGDVSSTYAVTPDSKVVVYLADQDVNDKNELYISYLGWQVYLPLSTR